MGGFLRFVTRSRYHAIGVSALSLLIPALSLLLSPFSFVGAAVVGLATLRYGASEGVVVLAGSAAVLAAAMWVLTGTVAPAVVFVAVTGLPTLALCSLLRVTSSQGTVLVAATSVVGAAMAGLYMTVPDPAAWWLDAFKGLLEAGTGDVDQPAFEQFAELLRMAVTVLPIAIVLNWMSIVLLARWGHAVLDNPGGFGREFRELRLGRRFASGAALIAIIALWAGRSDSDIGYGLLMLIVAACAIQGIALVHGLVALRRRARGWIIAMYASLLLVPLAAVLALSVAGFSDAWFDYRARSNRSQ